MYNRKKDKNPSATNRMMKANGEEKKRIRVNPFQLGYVHT